ncbi:Copper transporter [Thalictrum thalictroides]|uniref:Copper transport protein n=1 Tax=Thalictrum thalictroides TaxID=46969 RepID=A0A7J6WB39_THATH|nr:Copper transporter [Thalictrum thalictroides]
MDGMHHDEMMRGHNTTNGTMHHKMMMHMTFFWGKNAEVLFSGWPGTSVGMYVFALIIVFVLSMLIEWLSHSQFIKNSSSTSHISAGIVQTVMHTIRVGLSYLVMLALMSFNGGIFLMAVAGHSLGFFIFGSRVFKHGDVGQYEKQTDLPPMTC